MRCKKESKLEEERKTNREEEIWLTGERRKGRDIRQAQKYR